MRRPKIIGLLVVPLFSFGLACSLPKKATAEIIRGRIGLIQVACDTVSQKCYTPDGRGRPVYFSTISEIPEHQSTVRLCQSVEELGRAIAASMDCSRYGYSEEPYRRSREELLESLHNLGRYY